MNDFEDEKEIEASIGCDDSNNFDHDNHDCKVHNIWIYGRLPEHGRNYFCLKAFLSVKQKNCDNIIYLYNTIDSYDINHLKYLCQITSLPFSNIVFTNGKYGTLWDDIINTKQICDKLENSIIDSYKSGKYKRLFIRSYDTYYVALDWLNNFINKYNNILYLKDYITHIGEYSYCGRFWDDLYQGSQPLKGVDDSKKIK